MSKPLHYGTEAGVPTHVAICPECGSALYARASAWREEDGVPLASAIEFDCIVDADEVQHRYWQSDWQPVRDAIAKWCGATNE